MTIALYILSAIILIESIIILYLKNSQEEKQQEAISLNKERQRENERIEQSIQQKKSELADLNISIQNQTQTLKSITKSADEMRRTVQIQTDAFYKERIEEIKARLKEREIALSADLNEQLASIAESLDTERKKLKDLEDKQLAYIKAKQREEEIQQKKDYYRLVIDEDGLKDIDILREIQSRIRKKEVVDKVIYEAYFRKPYDTLMSHLFGTKTKICGIYKITSLISSKVYIGQSVDIRERMKTHIKTGISSDQATNKLYQAMKKEGIENFTFELLEEVSRNELNDREKYWIEFYKSKDIGLNSTAGGS